MCAEGSTVADAVYMARLRLAIFGTPIPETCRCGPDCYNKSRSLLYSSKAQPRRQSHDCATNAMNGITKCVGLTEYGAKEICKAFALPAKPNYPNANIDSKETFSQIKQQFHLAGFRKQQQKLSVAAHTGCDSKENHSSIQ
ncbi:hypothetical protein BSLG_002660 [Batrachochytrium salamandrivorans]|nr:hypothetical protein BSLG_002660 [Batrachochytrium salamandrivorans]